MNKYDPNKRTWKLTCRVCGSPFLSNSRKTQKCPTCYQEFLTITCSLCGKTFIGTRIQAKRKHEYIQLCPSCNKELSKKYPGRFAERCESCETIIKLRTTTGTQTCPECGNPTRLEETTCTSCGGVFKQYRNTFGKGKTICPSCERKIKLSPSAKRYQELISAGWTHRMSTDGKRAIIWKESEDSGRTVCKRCGQRFEKTGPRQVFCKHCLYVWKCQTCGEMFTNTDSRSQRFCSKSCAIADMHKSGILNSHQPEIDQMTNGNQIAITSLPTPCWEDITSENRKMFSHPGVWCKHIGDVILDLMATADVSREWSQIQSRMKRSTSNKYETLRQMNKDGKIRYALLYRCESYEEAMIFEYAYAEEIRKETGSWPKLWSPAPNQIKLYNNNKNKFTIKKG